MAGAVELMITVMDWLLNPVSRSCDWTFYKMTCNRTVLVNVSHFPHWLPLTQLAIKPLVQVAQLKLESIREPRFIMQPKQVEQ